MDIILIILFILAVANFRSGSTYCWALSTWTFPIWILLNRLSGS